ncbi:hypothetical protein TIFTF001_031903 [Ficus carica]|uniref:Uncharacterized protein n=1 Tax=Ficus carica TaxID=3494 RepID=A0AA88J5T9_FICCA|nr:hypothetical protein TIFTF001_031903 [Ficus carica]
MTSSQSFFSPLMAAEARWISSSETRTAQHGRFGCRSSEPDRIGTSKPFRQGGCRLFARGITEAAIFSPFKRGKQRENVQNRSEEKKGGR